MRTHYNNCKLNIQIEEKITAIQLLISQVTKLLRTEQQINPKMMAGKENIIDNMDKFSLKVSYFEYIVFILNFFMVIF